MRWFIWIGLDGRPLICCTPTSSNYITTRIIMVRYTAWVLPFLLGCTTAFTCNHVSSSSSSSSSSCRNSSPLHMSVDDKSTMDSRRSFLVQSTTAAVSAFSLVGCSDPALALGGGIGKVNSKLSAYGLPSMGKIPDGFVPLLEVYGKGKNRDPILVQFSHPIDWVVTLPSQDVNGEDGTIQAGEYAKGDTATFYVYSTPGKVENIESQDKEFFAKALTKAISQKGDNMYQNFKVTQVSFTGGEYKNQVYALVDFKYQLITGAGFEIDRVGVASVTSVGKAVEVLWAASTRQRYKKTEETLRAITSSFRCYADGLDLVKQEYNVV